MFFHLPFVVYETCVRLDSSQISLQDTAAQATTADAGLKQQLQPPEIASFPKLIMGGGQTCKHTTTTKRLKPFRCRCRCSRSMVTNIEICWFAFQDHPEVFEVSWGPVMFCPKLRTWTPLFQKEGWRACWMKLMVLLLTYFASSFYECPQFSGVSHVTATKPKHQSDGKQPMSLPLPVTWILTWSLFEQHFVLFFEIQDTFPVPLTAGALLR